MLVLNYFIIKHLYCSCLTFSWHHHPYFKHNFCKLFLLPKHDFFQTVFSLAIIISATDAPLFLQSPPAVLEWRWQICWQLCPGRILDVPVDGEVRAGRQWGRVAGRVPFSSIRTCSSRTQQTSNALHERQRFCLRWMLDLRLINIAIQFQNGRK